jgi:hypothetical protein
MNSPAATRLAQPEFDPSWTLFDQNSIEIAAGTYYQQDNLGTRSSIAESTPTLPPGDASLQHRENQGYNEGELWDAYGNLGSSWPSGFNRIFGNPSFLEAGDGSHLQ